MNEDDEKLAEEEYEVEEEEEEAVVLELHLVASIKICCFHVKYAPTSGSPSLYYVGPRI